MGYLTNKYVKNDKKKFWIQLILDAFLIFMLIFVSLMARTEFDNGAKFILQNVPVFCTNGTIYQEVMDFYNLTTETKIPNSFDIKQVYNQSGVL